MARIIFAFDGLGNYDPAHLAGAFGTSVLNFLRRSQLSVTPDVIEPGVTDMSQARDFVLYYDWPRVGDALAAFDALRLAAPFPLGGQPRFNTFAVVGHSLGGGAAWEFAHRLLDTRGRRVNFGLTLDPRNNHALTGDETEAAPWRRPGWRSRAAVRWVNYYQRTAGLFHGYAMPGLAPGDDNLVDRYDLPDVSHDRLLSYDASGVRPDGTRKTPATAAMLAGATAAGFAQATLP